MIVARSVAHHYHAERRLGIDAHHAPEPCPATEVFDEERATLLSGLAGAEPAQPEVPLSSPARDPLHLGHRLRREQPRAVHLTTVQVKQEEPGGLINTPDQPAVGSSLDIEGVEGHVPPVPRSYYICG